MTSAAIVWSGESDLVGSPGGDRLVEIAGVSSIDELAEHFYLVHLDEKMFAPRLFVELYDAGVTDVVALGAETALRLQGVWGVSRPAVIWRQEGTSDLVWVHSLPHPETSTQADADRLGGLLVRLMLGQTGPLLC